MKAAYIRKTIYMIFLLAVLFSAGCGTNDQSEPDPIGIKIKSPKFDEIAGIYTDVTPSLKFTNSNGGVTECNVFIGTDTKVKGTCGDMPFGTYAYNLEYTYQGLTIAKSIGSITIDENNTETPITLLDKGIDEDNDGCSNLQEVIVGSNPLVQDTCIPPPTDLTAAAKSTVQIDLTWTESSGATGYKIFRREGSDGADTEIGTSTQTSYSDTGLNADTTYCYKVSANGNGTESIPADIVCAKTENGLVAYYPFNGNANDESGNGNNGVVNGATLTTDRFGKADSAYSFDGVNDYIDIGQLAKLQDSQEITVMIWIKKSVHGGVGGFVGKWDTSPNGTNTFLIYNGEGSYNNNGAFALSFNDNTNGGVQATSILPINEWINITATWRSSDGRMIIYKNGVLESSTIVGVGKKLKYHTSYTAKIGEWGILRNSQYKLNGLIDDIRIYNRALTDTEVLALYNEGK